MSFNIALLFKKSVFCPASSAPLSFQERDLIMLMSLCTVWWRRSLKSPHKVENASELQLTSISDQYLLYVFMYSWVYNGAPQPCFSRSMVDYTLMTDQMTTIFVFHFIWVMYQEAEFATNIRSTSSDINENQPKHQNRNFLKTFCNYLLWNCILPSLNLILDIPITKLTELWL